MTKLTLCTILALSLTFDVCAPFTIRSKISIREVVGNHQNRIRIPSHLEAQRISISKKKESLLTFQYSPSSLKHLEAVELPADYSRPWTKEKIQAIGGAFALGAISAFLGENIVQFVFDGAEKGGVLTGAVGTAMGWYLCGGGDVMEAEQASTGRNGGYDAKLVADKPSRLTTVLEDLNQAYQEENKKELVLEKDPATRDLTLPTKYICTVHGEEYFKFVQEKSQQTDRPIRFNPLYARTLIDQFSFDAARHAVADWMDSVDAALDLKRRPMFALVRPPSHHACKEKGMGGCFFNSVAIAAFYALDQPTVNNVAILDIDAHHGNGIAHCIENEPRIRFCSMHEEKSGTGYIIEQKEMKDDPRTSEESDQGPLENILNVNLKSGTGWETGYNSALVEKAIPFLLRNDPDVLIVAAGFDAMLSDGTSQLTLLPEDYEKLGEELRIKFGDKIAFGLEGGYSWQDRGLSQAILKFVEPWQR